jgi:hypothetical protein
MGLQPHRKNMVQDLIVILEIGGDIALHLMEIQGK